MVKPVSLSVSSGSITINDDSSVQILAEEIANLNDLDSQVSLLDSSLMNHLHEFLPFVQFRVQL